ncbi:hypothetical protein EVG20_g7915 [Dentipellis fragilis]|uniref:O-methyltransferase C-terminal domain-containing protein n=1 Tax=Dentipellis fragilis TaxID=205917 RepID=A0A4Y9Y988_9AGAM|nr:hypothetical protein EVG20_g7915 [Dentipellis fragilis]
MLASNHIFRETTPDVFTHNRLSSVIDTGKPFEVVKKDPAGKHDGTMGVCAMVGQMHDEGLKSLAVLWDTLRDPKFGHSQEPNEAAFSKAFNTDKSFFEWFELPGNEHRFRRTSVLMDGTSRLNPPGTILKGFDFGALPEGARVVDVAGGIGSVSLAIAQAHPKINITLEDRPQVILEAQKFWKANLPEALDTGRVRLIAADMFSAQSDIAAQPEIFIIRQIMHDWSDLYSIRILKCLRDAAGPNTRLLVVDNVLSYACAQTSNEVAIKGAELPAAPAPLLPNFGTARSWPYVMDVMMMIWQNGQERTLLHYANILKSTGWELKEIRRAMGSGLGHLVAVPV